MKVLRIQDSEGFGPYAGRQDIEPDTWQDSPHGNEAGKYRTPGPVDDDMLRAHWNRMDYNEKQQWKFGFLTGDQLRKWFTKTEIKKLVLMGFKVVKIEVNEVLPSKKQAMWRGLTT